MKKISLKLSHLELFVESAVSKFQQNLSRKIISAKNALSAENGAKMRLAARPKVRLQFSKFSGTLVNLSVASSYDMF